MKRLWISAALILALCVLAGVHVVCLGRFIGELDGLLSQAEGQVAAEDWPQAEALTRQALDRWESRAFYLHSTLRHEDVDEVTTSYHEVLAFLEGGEKQPAEYAAANARLRVQLSLLLEEELPTLENVL